MMGYGYGLVSGFCYGTLNILAKTVMDDYEVPPYVVASIAIFFGGMMIGPLVARDLPQIVRTSKWAVLMFSCSGLAAGGAVIALYSSLQRADVVVITPVVAVSPLITLILARVFLQRLERLSLRVVLGTFLVVGGTALVIVGDVT